MARIKLIESASASFDLDKVVKESLKDLPSVIYPEIHAITANKKTRNKTYYPKESLLGSIEDISGINSLLSPYPVPIIKDHNTGGGLSSASEIFGRVLRGNFVEGNPGYLSVIAEITDPYAIERILTNRFLTVSIGVETEHVYCSICNSDFASEDACDHRKGQSYYNPLTGKAEEAFWKMGPVWFQEISFVTVPSDNEAKVINKNSLEFAESKKVFSIPSKEIKEEKEVEEILLVLEDKKNNKDISLLTVSKSNCKDVYDHVLSSSLNEDYKEKLITRLAKFCKTNNLELSFAQTYSEIDFSNLEKLSISLNESNHQMLCSFINSMKHYITEVSMDNPSIESTESVTEVTTETVETNEKEEVKESEGFKVTESEVLELKESITSLGEELTTLTERCIEANTKVHLRTASEVALLCMFLGKREAKDKTLEELTLELSKRVLVSLEDKRNDLLLEFLESPVKKEQAAEVEIKVEEKISNPVSQEIPEGKLGVVGELKEEEEDIVYMTFGASEKVSKA